MFKRVWPFGTTKEVKVLKVIKQTTATGLICAELGPGAEGFGLMLSADHKAAREAEVNDLGVITFHSGGPTGGYWDYERKQERLHHIMADPPEVKDERWNCVKCERRFYNYADATKHVC